VRDVRGIAMTGTMPSQKIVILQSPEVLQIDQIQDNNLDGPNEEQAVVDCPDCFDTMIKVYDSDKIRYRCENCDLITGTKCL
jgi:ribosomal protein S27E